MLQQTRLGECSWDDQVAAEKTPFCHLNVLAEGEPHPSERWLLWTVAIISLLVSGATGDSQPQRTFRRGAAAVPSMLFNTLPRKPNRFSWQTIM
ncbi:uncharacterized protein [Narcine bancroftii]|uniref:uncharacterized protein isoform X2 n=1 Tax=Narcine bancroftii TaxID=1343680 RepID=UPI00383175AF